jgi:FdrA protein
MTTSPLTGDPVSTLKVRVLNRLYRDSVALMAIASATERRDGVERAAAVMGTQSNRDLLSESGMLPPGLTACPDDLIMVVRGVDEEAVDSALDAAEAALAATEATSQRSERRPATIAEGIAAAAANHPATVATVSVPGTYAPIVTEQALRRGLHVMCFSDNVAVADEVRLKRMAAARRLLLMGPDCGTAILDGVPLGFANVVNRGPVGIVAASGTGAQEVSCLLHRAGTGVSQLIGVGGRDLSAEVGAAMTLMALDLLGDDPDTRVVVVVSKPPAAEVADTVLNRLVTIASGGIPVVAGFLGMPDSDPAPNAAPVHVRGTLEGAAQAAASLTGNRLEVGNQPSVEPVDGQVLGLFTGGTLASEATLLLGHAGITARVLDLGDDRYTSGRPHPMIDPTARADRLVAAAQDTAIALVLFDVVLGHGATMDPATPVADAVRMAREVAAAGGRKLAFVGSVCGTGRDPQDRDAQIAILRDAGVIVAQTNAAAARLAAAAVKGASA